MFLIRETPGRLKSFFRTFVSFFEARQWPHFQALVVVLALAHGRRNISHMNLFLEDRTRRQRRQDFLVESPWEGPAVLEAGARAMIERLKPKQGERLEVLLDFTHTPKRGKTMEGAHRYFDPVTKSYRFGHTFLLCVLRLRGVVIPWALRPWMRRDFCRSQRAKELGLKFKTSNQLAAEVIRELPEELTSRFAVRVLFDSAFLNREVVGACRDRGFNFLSVAKSNRVFFPFVCHRKQSVRSYGPGVLRTAGRNIRIATDRGQAEFRVASRVGTMRGIGVVQVVFSRRHSDGSFVALVTDDTEMSARDVVVGYRARWSIEVTLKNLKQYLGLGDYQTARYEGLIHHLHLCLISFQLLTTLGLKGSAKKYTAGAAIESIPRLQERLRMFVAKEQIHRLRRSKNPARALSRLEHLLVAA